MLIEKCQLKSRTLEGHVVGALDWRGADLSVQLRSLSDPHGRPVATGSVDREGRYRIDMPEGRQSRHVLRPYVVFLRAGFC